MVNISREEIKSRFRTEAIEHGKAIANGDHKKANKLHKKLQVLYVKAKEHNKADVFSELLYEADESVRLWASTFTLKVYPDLAEQSLENLSELSSIVGLSAKTTLHLWKEGKLDLL